MKGPGCCKGYNSGERAGQVPAVYLRRVLHDKGRNERRAGGVFTTQLYFEGGGGEWSMCLLYTSYVFCFRQCYFQGFTQLCCHCELSFLTILNFFIPAIATSSR